MKKLHFYSVAIFYCHVCHASNDNAIQEPVLYETAIQELSTAPLYVLITITDVNLNKSKSVCTSANFLLGAIHKEYGLGFGVVESKKATEIAIANKDHRFAFSKPEAIANIPVYYTPEDLNAVRKRLENLSIQEIKKGLKKRGNLMEAIFNEPSIANQFKKNSIPVFAFRDAFACVLVERGLQIGKKDGSSNLHIYNEDE